MILSDRTIREAIDSGRIVIDPFDPAKVQPSSVDLTLDHRFLVFRNHTRGVIDVKEDLSDLTELIEITEKWQEAAGPVVAGVQAAHAELISSYSDEELETIVDFLTRFTQNVVEHTRLIEESLKAGAAEAARHDESKVE